MRDKEITFHRGTEAGITVQFLKSPSILQYTLSSLLKENQTIISLAQNRHLPTIQFTDRDFQISRESQHKSHYQKSIIRREFLYVTPCQLTKQRNDNSGRKSTKHLTRT